MEQEFTENIKDSSDEPDRRREVCTMAPEWAEHERLDGSDYEVCDDGRSGVACGRRETDDPCPIESGPF